MSNYKEDIKTTLMIVDIVRFIAIIFVLLWSVNVLIDIAKTLQSIDAKLDKQTSESK